MPDGIIVPNYQEPGISLGTIQPGQTIVVRFSVRINNDISDGHTLQGIEVYSEGGNVI